MLRLRDEDQWMVGKSFGNGLVVLRRSPHDCDVDAVVPKQFHNVFTIVNLDAQFDLRVAAAKRRQHARRKILGSGNDADDDAPTARAAQLHHGFLQLAQLLRHATGVAGHLVAGRREVDTLADLLGQRHAGDVLERAYLHRDGRLGKMEFFRRAREGQMTRHRLENLQLPKGNVQHGVSSGVAPVVISLILL